MLTILRRNSTRFANSKKSCDERSRKYDVRKKIQSVVTQIELEKKLDMGESLELHELLELLVPHVEFHPYPQYVK